MSLQDKESCPENTIFRRKGRLRTWVVPFFLILLVSAFAFLGLKELSGAFLFQKAALDQGKEALGIQGGQEFPRGTVNIALFGVDSRQGEFQGLSDSIMILSVDQSQGRIKLVSVMRDSLVMVEGHGVQKINSAYRFGGAQLAVKTLNQTFGLNIRDYATVDFNSMEELVDGVGGIEITLTPAELESANKNILDLCQEMGKEPRLIAGPGLQTLNGMQAVAYSRIRNVGTATGALNDFGRTERQRNVMNQLFQQALNLKASRYPALAAKILPHMETSLEYGEIMNMAGILGREELNFIQARMPTNKILIDADFRAKNLGSCVYYNLDYAAEMMQSFLFENCSFEDYCKENPVCYDEWYKK